MRPRRAPRHQCGTGPARFLPPHSVILRCLDPCTTAALAEHLPKLLVEASRGVEVANADDLLAKVEELRLKAMDVLTQAEEAHDHRVVLAAIDRASKQLELLAKLLGEISDAPQVNIHLHPEWIELRTVIVGALEPHPEARGAVLRAIEGVDNGR